MLLLHSLVMKNLMNLAPTFTHNLVLDVRSDASFSAGNYLYEKCYLDWLMIISEK